MARGEEAKRPSLPRTQGGIGPEQARYLEERSAAFANATQRKGMQMSYPMPNKKSGR